jgi:crotonobetainyl-CoA:carnitine CoA-transferase CaiB-like acyl-CoA transferase
MSTRLGVLSGHSVAEFGDAFPQAVCAYHLGLLGAEIVLHEPPDGGALRRYSALFAYAGRGKRVGAVTAPVDVLLEPAFAPLPIDTAGPDWARTLFVSFREMDGSQLTELTAQAEGGLTSYLGQHGQAPLRAGFELVTYSAGVLAVQAVLAGLRQRAITGRGQRVRVPLSRVCAGILNNIITASAEPDQHVHFSRGWEHAPSRGLQAADGLLEILFYGPAGERAWAAFCHRLGAEALIDDPRFRTHPGRLDHAAELCDALVPWTGKLPRDAVISLIRACGGMAMPIHTVGEAVAWEQTTANAMVSVPPGAILPAAPWELNGVRPSA